MPDWGKMNYHQHQAKDWKEIVPGIPAEARDLVAKLVCYSSSRRLSAHSVRHVRLCGSELLIRSRPWSTLFSRTTAPIHDYA